MTLKELEEAFNLKENYEAAIDNLRKALSVNNITIYFINSSLIDAKGSRLLTLKKAYIQYHIDVVENILNQLRNCNIDTEAERMNLIDMTKDFIK